MILGDVCTRGCRFCSITTGKPHVSAETFEAEAERVADAAAALDLRYVVITSVARDDLEDGGASGFAYAIAALRRRLPQAGVEVLIPDFRGDDKALSIVVEAKPDVINHNLETVPRLYRRVRPGSSYIRSLQLLQRVKGLDSGIATKTGIMLGLGETPTEIEQVFLDAFAHSIDIFTAGQYMRPTRDHLPVERYVPPDEFELLKARAVEIGFRSVFMGPLVRSSYHAGEVFGEVYGE
jgi:lipoic acid synthetase